MYTLGKWLFPKQPRLVRERKLRDLFFTVVLSAMACMLIGLLMLALNRTGHN